MASVRPYGVAHPLPASMLAFLKLLQSLVKTLHSDGSPHQIGLGLALGACLGLTPIANIHNAVVLLLLCILNVSFGAGMLGWALFIPLGFALDPVFDRVGYALLQAPALRDTWTAWDNMPFMPLTSFNNTIVLGSLVAWLVLFVPIWLLGVRSVVAYRATLGEKVRRTRAYQAITASQAYNVYTWFRG